MANTSNPLPIEKFFEPIDAPVSRDAQQLYDYWRGLADPPDLPARDSIRLEALAELGCADRVFILQPIDGGADWHYRLLGTQIAMLYEHDITKVPFREFMRPDEAERAIELSNHVLATREPLFLQARYVAGEKRPPIETMSLPITGRDGAEIWLFGGTFFT